MSTATVYEVGSSSGYALSVKEKAREWAASYGAARSPDQFLPFEPDLSDLMNAFVAGYEEGCRR